MGVRSAAMVHRSQHILLTLVVCATSVTGSMFAQLPAPIVPNALRLVVVNDRDVPVPLAEVIVAVGSRSTRGRTDSTGVFRADGLPLGDFHATIRRIGYNESAVDLHIGAGDNAFTVTVDASSETLKDVNIVGRKTSVRLAEYEGRKARGEPSAVITREQIAKRNPVKLSQMFRTIPGVQIADDQGLKYPIATRGTAPRNGVTVAPCPMRIAVDGMIRPPFTNLDEIVPSEVHGVEVYYGPASLPMQLATFRVDKWCGLVAIWTKDR